MTGEIYSNTSISFYQPSKEVQELTGSFQEDFYTGTEILNRSWPELNDYSIIERMNKDQRTYNAFVDESTENPADAWKWKGTRSMARNKAVVTHANITSSYILPEVEAQNDSDEEDRDMSDIMESIVEWMTNPGNSNYRPAFLIVSMGMLVNPVTYLGADYAMIYQTVKERLDDGTYTKQEIIDEVLSGFQARVYSADEILITNAYEQNIQKQRRIIKTRYIDYSEAKARWGEHENWAYVQKGIKTIFNDENGLFYDVKDESNIKNLVQEVTGIGRREDIEVCWINGIYMGDSDVDANPVKHRDNKNAPKYNITPFGYHRIGEHFFFYKSQMNVLGWDNQLIDGMYETTMNKELLNLLMPTAITGEAEVDTDIIFPGAVVAFANPATKVTPLLPPNNAASGYNAMSLIERSMSEGSVSDVQGGQLPDPNQKAYSVAQAAQNAQTVLSGVGKTLAESVAQYGMLMIDIASTQLTLVQVEELAGGITKEKYKSFILNDKIVAGKKMSKRIKFDDSLMGVDMTDQQKEEAGVKMAEEVGYPDNKEHLYRVNPELFRRLKYMCKVDPQRMFPKNQEYQQGIMNQLYALLRQDPLIEPEALLRKLTYAYFRGEGEELIAKGGGIAAQIMNQQPANPQQVAQVQPTNPLSTAVKNGVAQ